jgi:hypothetical protein
MNVVWGIRWDRDDDRRRRVLLAVALLAALATSRCSVSRAGLRTARCRR